MKPPDKIYLQACGDCPGFDSCQSCKFDDLEEVTWAEEKVWEKDIPYIRKEAILEWAKEMKTANETYVDKDEPEATQWYKHGAYHICNELIDKLDSL